MGPSLSWLSPKAGAHPTPPQTGPQQTEAQEPSDSDPEAAAATATTAPFFFIIGDTSYGACCADEVAAQHLRADCIVHYGPACLSPTARLPVIHVFGRRPLSNPQAAAAGIARYVMLENTWIGWNAVCGREGLINFPRTHSALRAGGGASGDEATAPVRRALLFYDLGYAHAIPELSRLLQTQLEAGATAGSEVEVVVARLPPRPPVPAGVAAASVGEGGGCCDGGGANQGCGLTVPAATQQKQQSEPQLGEQEEQGGPRTVIAGGLEVVLPEQDEGGEQEGRRTVVVYIGTSA